MNVSPKTVDALEQRGVEVMRVSSLLPADVSDDAILNLARQEAMLLIIQDLDFSSILAVGGYERPSLITLRLSQTDPDTVTERLWEVIP
jgi:predicted nuclease of predicted toxin-antitoxin system